MDLKEFIAHYKKFVNAIGVIDLLKAPVGHGGTLLLYGLRKETNDIDVAVSAVIFKKLKERKYPISDFQGNEVIHWDSKVDVHLDDTSLGRTVKEGVGTWTLETVLQEKKKLNREKDQADIKKIEELLKKEGVSNLSSFYKW
jgi:hypothetical protein